MHQLEGELDNIEDQVIHENEKNHDSKTSLSLLTHMETIMQLNYPHRLRENIYGNYPFLMERF